MWALSTVVDPYGRGTFGLSQKLEPFRHHPVMGPAAKIALLESGECERLILGTSRAEFAFNPAHPRFSSLKTCNLGISASNIREQLELMKRALARAETREILWSLDFAAFQAGLPARRQFTESPIATQLDRVSWRSIVDSYDLVGRYLRGERSGYTSDGYLKTPGFKAWPITRFKNDWKTYMQGIDLYRDFRLDKAAFADLESLLDQAKERGISVRGVILPVHVAHFAMIEIKGQAGIYADWTERASQAFRERGLMLVDFSSASSPNDEAVSLTKAGMNWFWDSGHITAAYGNLITEEIFSDTRVVGKTFSAAGEASIAVEKMMGTVIAWMSNNRRLIARMSH